MPSRLLLILTLLLPQLVLPAWPIGRAPGDVRAAACEATCCCVVVETTTCCGRTVREMRCGRTGGECLCGVQPADPEQTPEAPRPDTRNDLVPVFALARAGAIDLPAPVPALRPWLPPAPRRTHAEIRALLCIWRT